MKILKQVKYQNDKCQWWVHIRCVNLFYPNTDEGEAALDAWAKDHFYCKNHIPDAPAIGWDKFNGKEREENKNRSSAKKTSVRKLRQELSKKVKTTTEVKETKICG